jgi:hypothetical protein
MQKNVITYNIIRSKCGSRFFLCRISIYPWFSLNPIVKPLILQFENMLYVFFLTHFNGYTLIGINKCCVCVWWPSLNSFMTNLHRFSVKTSDLCLKFVCKIIAMIDIIIISLKNNFFLSWYSWNIAELALNNNHSVYM